MNPIIYCFINDSFQRNLLRTLRCRCLTPYIGDTGVVRGQTATPVSGARARQRSGDGPTNGGRSTDSTAVTTASLSLNTAALHSTFV